MTDSRDPSLSICVLLGGEAAERSVSLVSGKAAGQALLERGHRITFLEPATGARVVRRPGDSTEDLARRLDGGSPHARTIVPSILSLAGEEIDVVANLLHGGTGEGGGVQAILELLGIPFMGSGSVASMISMDKALSRSVFQAHGIPIAEGFLWRPEIRAPGAPLPPRRAVGREADPARDPATSPDGAVPPVEIVPPGEAELAGIGGYPLVVKPIAQGSTVGITIVGEAADWPAAYRTAQPYIDPRRGLLIEKYIPGRELTVSIVEGVDLPVVEIRPKTGFYDFERKYTPGATEYVVPAPLPGEIAANLVSWSRQAFAIFGCEGIARVDFRLDPEGRAACLELNTIPGMTPTSLVPMAAKSVGIGFGELLERLCLQALAKRPEPGDGRKGGAE